jgi:hypothetical protein
MATVRALASRREQPTCCRLMLLFTMLAMLATPAYSRVVAPPIPSASLAPTPAPSPLRPTPTQVRRTSKPAAAPRLTRILVSDHCVLCGMWCCHVCRILKLSIQSLSSMLSCYLDSGPSQLLVGSSIHSNCSPLDGTKLAMRPWSVGATFENENAFFVDLFFIIIPGNTYWRHHCENDD